MAGEADRTEEESCMSAENVQKIGLKQKIIREFEEVGVIFLYLAFFFCAIATYSMLLLNKFQVSYFTYGTALINALVIAKVILIGDYMHLGKKQEARSLIYLAVYRHLCSACSSSLFTSLKK
jgi:hypothetical protein